VLTDKQMTAKTVPLPKVTGVTTTMYINISDN